MKKIILIIGIILSLNPKMYSQFENKDSLKTSESDYNLPLEKKHQKSFESNTVQFSCGYGLGHLYAPIMGRTERTIYKERGAMHYKMEFAISDKVGLGVNINHNSSVIGYKTYPSILLNSVLLVTNMSLYGDNLEYWHFDNSSYSYLYKVQNTSVNFRFNHHFYSSKKLDMYYGLGIGFRSRKSELIATNDSQGADTENFADTRSIIFPIGLETTFGMKYYLANHIALYTEVGPAKSFLQTGIVCKF